MSDPVGWIYATVGCATSHLGMVSPGLIREPLEDYDENAFHAKLEDRLTHRFTTQTAAAAGPKLSDLEVSWMFAPPGPAFRTWADTKKDGDFPLNWMAGIDEFNLPDTKVFSEVGDFSFPMDAANFGLTTAAGASGSTFVMLLLAKVASFTALEQKWLRLALLAWMIPQQDHSFYEIMIGAEDQQPLKFAQHLKDLWDAANHDVYSEVFRYTLLDGADRMNDLDGVEVTWASLKLKLEAEVSATPTQRCLPDVVVSEAYIKARHEKYINGGGLKTHPCALTPHMN